MGSLSIRLGFFISLSVFSCFQRRKKRRNLTGIILILFLLYVLYETNYKPFDKVYLENEGWTLCGLNIYIFLTKI